MVHVVAVVVSALVVALAAAALLFARASSLDRRLAEAREGLELAERQALAARAEVQAFHTNARAIEPHVAVLEARIRELGSALEAAVAEDEKKTGWLDHQEREMEWLRAELEKRPKVTRKTYKILTLGVKWTGKTSLTLKWANPLVDIGKIEGTKIERYERTVSQVAAKDVTTEHVFEIGDWGGEHIVDAQQELIMDEIHGLLIVVDLGGKDAKAVEPSRVEEQLREFQPESLKFLFGPKTVASCKAVVLFINKSDLLPGSPAEVEAKARAHYARLIESLGRYQSQVDIRVFVGSASYGHSTHLLFSYFVEKILPRNAYDSQLLQRMKTDAPAAPPRKPAIPPAPVAGKAAG